MHHQFMNVHDDGCLVVMVRWSAVIRKPGVSMFSSSDKCGPVHHSDGMVRWAGKGWVLVTSDNDTVCVQWWWCLMVVMCEEYRLVWYGLILLARGCFPTSSECMGEMHHLPGLGSSCPPFPFQRVTQWGLCNKEPRVTFSPSFSLYLNLAPVPFFNFTIITHMVPSSRNGFLGLGLQQKIWCEIKKKEKNSSKIKRLSLFTFPHCISSLMLLHFLDELTYLTRHSPVASQQ